jgi:hypothetical protein
MALVFQLDASTGNIVLSGTVDGVDLAALKTDVEGHDHTVGGNVASATETLPICDTDGTPLSCHCAKAGGADARYEQGIGGTGSRTHNHAASDGSGALTTSVTYASTGMSPKTDNEIIFDHTVGDITCDLIDGVAPEVLWDEYDDHYHTLTGETAYTEMPGLQAYGNSGTDYAWFWVSDSSDGSSPYWTQLFTNSGQHRHTANTLQTAVEDAGSGAGSDDAGDPKITVDHTTGNLALKGDVNGIGIAQFHAAYDAHQHTGGAGGQTGTNTGNAGKAQLRAAGTTDVWVDTSAGWKWPYIYPSDHYHAGSTLGVGLTFGTPT